MNINDLSPEERLRLIEELWDSLDETSQNIRLTNAQREELTGDLIIWSARRLTGIPWDEILHQIRSRAN